MFKLEILILNNGERYPILIDSVEGVPHYHATIWVTAILRPTCSVNTIRNKLYALQWLFAWERRNGRNLVEEFKQGKFLNHKDLVNLKEHFRETVHSNLENKKQYPKFFSNSLVVSSSHQYNRMTAIAEYLDFLIKMIQFKDKNLMIEAANMIRIIRNLRPKIKSRSDVNFTHQNYLPDGLLDEFVDLANYSNPKNPFRDKGIKKRNHLMFLLLRQLGIRKGELLSIKLSDMDLTGVKPAIIIRRVHDDLYDTRKRQAVAKTKERRLVISHEITNLIDDYIVNYRAKIPYANKHPYLFVTHKKGKFQGNPLSISSFDNVIISLMKKVDSRYSVIHAHLFRHEWNLDFSRKVDLNNQLAQEGKAGYTEISPENEAKYRQHWMGHSSEKSSYIYNRRHIFEQATKIALMEQNELKNKLSKK